MLNSLQRIIAATVVAIVIAPHGESGECPRHRTTPSQVFSETDELPEQKLNKTYEILEKLNRYNYTTEERLHILEKSFEPISVNWVYNTMFKTFIPYIDDAIVRERVPLLKFAKLFPGYAALPKASGRFRAYHGRFTNLSRVCQSQNATYNAYDNEIRMITHARVHNATFMYRNYELEVNDKRIEGSIYGSFDYIELRFVNGWKTAPKCELMYALYSLYDWENCKADVNNLGEYGYLNIELEITVCKYIEKTLKEVISPTVRLTWDKAAEDSQMCKHKLFKDIFGVTE